MYRQQSQFYDGEMLTGAAQVRLSYLPLPRLAVVFMEKGRSESGQDREQGIPCAEKSEPCITRHLAPMMTGGHDEQKQTIKRSPRKGSAWNAATARSQTLIHLVLRNVGQPLQLRRTGAAWMELRSLPG
jgi:hypothetical protein